MSKFALSAVGIAGLGAAGWVAWTVGEELLYQSRMQPLVDEALRYAESSKSARRLLGSPPYIVHSGGRHSARPVFRTFQDRKTGDTMNEALLWIEGSLGACRLAVIGDSASNLRYAGLVSQTNQGTIVLYSPDMASRKASIFSYLTSVLFHKK